VLSSITPAEAAFAPQARMHTAIGPCTVTIGIAPTRRGPESFRVVVTGRTDATSLPQSLQLELSQAAGPVRALGVSFPYRLPGAIRPGTPTPITFPAPPSTCPPRAPGPGP
jgi:copper transport protein